jgi:CRP/FNR family cyclic AMP-dependent transcriptional regulator
MNDQDLTTVILRSPLATELSSEECAHLAKIVTMRHLDDEEMLIRESEVDNSLHVIVKGRLEVVKNTGGGDSTTLHILRTGELAGELGFIDGLEHSASLRSAGETEVFSLNREGLERLLSTHPQIVYKVMRAIIREVHAIVRRMNTQYVEMTNYITKVHGRY